MNVYTFSGHLGKDAEIRFTQNGESVTAFSVAVKSGYGKNESTTWINCNYWGKRGESVAPYLKKGAHVIVSGEFTLRKWSNKEGQEQLSPDLNVRDLTLAGPRREAAENDVPQSGDQGSVSGDLKDDIPF